MLNKGIHIYQAELAEGATKPDNMLRQYGSAQHFAARKRPNKFSITDACSLLFKYFAVLMALATIFITSCSDPERIVDDNKAIANQNWTYGNKIRFDVQIDDPSVAYNLYINVRVTANYRYSNMFVLIAQSGGGSKTTNVGRYELKLASPTGEWLGQGSGSMYSYQIPFRKKYRFPAKGRYRFEIEQNMRDNPLHAVSNVGLRIEKSK